MLTDYDAQPGRRSRQSPNSPPPNGKRTKPNCYAGLRGVAGIVAGARGVFELLGRRGRVRCPCDSRASTVRASR